MVQRVELALSFAAFSRYADGVMVCKLTANPDRFRCTGDGPGMIAAAPLQMDRPQGLKKPASFSRVIGRNLNSHGSVALLEPR